MGTVGLSFGSPTSGAGFDVSSTVSAIMANLENVETPWKNQLTTLQSQDTVISNLGTLLSSLANDVSQLTDFTGIMAQKTGSSSDTNVLQLTNATSAATAGTHSVVVKNLATTSSGYLTALPSASATLTGSITLSAGNGKAQTITLDSSDDTLSGLASAINQSGVGVTASVLTDSAGSRLSLVSGTSGAKGSISISANTLAATSNSSLSYVASGASAGTLSGVPSAKDTLSGTISIQVGSGTATTLNVDAADGDNTLTSLMNAINGDSSLGVTAAIVSNNDGTQSLSLSSQSGDALTVTPNLTDTGTPLSYTQSVPGQDAALEVDGVNLTSASNTVTNLIAGVTFQLLAPSATQADGSLEQMQVIIGNDNSGVESAVNSMVTDYNALIKAVNAQTGNDASGKAEPLFGSPTLSLLHQQLSSLINQQNPNGYLTPVTVNSSTALTGSLTVQAGNGTAETVVIGAAPATPAANTIYTGAGADTLQDVANAITSAGIGVSAGVTTANGQSTLNLLSQTAGSTGALTVTSQLTATSATLLGFTGIGGGGGVNASGVLDPIPNANDLLSGTLTIQVGGGTAQTITIDSSNNTLATLAAAINNTPGIGVTASVAPQPDGTVALAFQSQTADSAGDLTVTSNVLDTTHTTTTNLAYTNSSDISTLANLGITISQSDDGSLSYDASVLDNVLNTDYSSVVGFFQNANSWGQSFATMLENAGTSSTTGILALASSSNSSTESELNAEISKENNLITQEQKSLTAELTSANEILQGLPTQLQGVNELYSAISGYNQNKG